MKNERKIQNLSSNSSGKRIDGFPEVLKIANRFQFIDKKLDLINSNNKNILKTMQNITYKSQKAFKNLRNKKVRSSKFLQEIVFPLSWALNIPNHSGENSPIEIKKFVIPHFSVIPSRFKIKDRNSIIDKTSVDSIIDKTPVDSINNKTIAKSLRNSKELNFSEMLKINNFLICDKSKNNQNSVRKKLITPSSSPSNKQEKMKDLLASKEIEKKSARMAKIMKEYKRHNEERAATIIDSCKSSENRLLISLNKT